MVLLREKFEMYKITAVLIGVIAALHFYIAWFEIFAWVERGPRVFSALPVDLFPPTKAMAANQGIYNAFLAIGLTWSLLITDTKWWAKVATCFLLFVAIAGIVGAMTISTRILFIQTVPAVIAIGLVFLSRKR